MIMVRCDPHAVIPKGAGFRDGTGQWKIGAGTSDIELAQFQRWKAGYAQLCLKAIQVNKPESLDSEPVCI